MKIMILSVGIRVKLVEYFQKAGFEVVATDMSPYAPGLYVADRHYLTGSFGSQEYLEQVLTICEREQVQGVLSLIDPEIAFLSTHRARFEAVGTRLILSAPEVIAASFNKQQFHDECQRLGIETVPTYERLEDFLAAREQGLVDFPVFVKPVCGSASLDIQKIEELPELEHVLATYDQMIIQPFMTGPEYGVDLYCDLESGELIQYFVKEKLKMRAGETDKAQSVKIPAIDDLVMEVATKMTLAGPINLDVFEHQGKFYLSEMNPRFGGGYPFAQCAGADFPRLIKENLAGRRNPGTPLAYSAGTVMMKYSEVLVAPGES